MVCKSIVYYYIHTYVLYIIQLVNIYYFLYISMITTQTEWDNYQQFDAVSK